MNHAVALNDFGGIQKFIFEILKKENNFSPPTSKTITIVHPPAAAAGPSVSSKFENWNSLMLCTTCYCYESYSHLHREIIVPFTLNPLLHWLDRSIVQFYCILAWNKDFIWNTQYTI